MVREAGLRREIGLVSLVRVGLGLGLGFGLTFGVGCSTSKVHSRGVYHRVRSGENLYRIGKAYGVSVPELSRINRIEDPRRLAVGQRLVIPGASRTLPVRLITPDRVEVGRPSDRSVSSAAGPFTWPIGYGRLTSRFGPRGRAFHDGIDIGAPVGTPVYAARDGRVLYSDRLTGYGNVVIIGHGAGYATVYAHNSSHAVRSGDRVRQGQVIAWVGQTGRTSGPNLHFEVRKDNVARNPLHFLPQPRRPGAAAVGG
jgi:murein DD-endopeptidase MepM/ murein hydrolase activator NlpD